MAKVKTKAKSSKEELSLIVSDIKSEAKKTIEHFDSIIEIYEAIKNKENITVNMLEVIKYARVFANKVYYRTEGLLPSKWRNKDITIKDVEKLNKQLKKD
jgi:hypothetical protein